LALSGTLVGNVGPRAMINAFPRLETLRAPDGFGAGAVHRYAADWEIVAPAHPGVTELDPRILRWMEQSLAGQGDSGLGSVMPGRVNESRNAAALGVLTLGDILYNAYRIDPHVMEAADFSRVQDLGSPAAFAGF